MMILLAFIMLACLSGALAAMTCVLTYWATDWYDTKFINDELAMGYFILLCLLFFAANIVIYILV